MGWLYFLGVLLLIFLIGTIPIYITVLYQSEPEVWVRVFFFRFRVLPGKEKKLNLKSFRIRKFRKMRLKERAKLREKARRAAEKKTKKEAQKKAKREKKAADKKAGVKKSLRQTFKELKGKADFGLSIARDVAFPLVTKYYRHLRVDVTKIRLTVATGDAAKTAQTYGIACAALADLLAILEQSMHLRYKKDAEVTVIPDFLGEESTIDLHIDFGLRIHHVFSPIFGAAIDFIKLLINKA